MIIVTLLLGACPTLAQLPPVTQAPPRMDFAPWKEVGRTSTMIEYTASFPSPVATEYPANDTVPLRVFVPVEGSGAKPVVLVLHYWGANDLRLERSLADELARNGIGSVLMTLPYHLGRTPPGFRSGELAIEPDPERLKRTMTQSVLDGRRALDFIVSHPEFRADSIGIAGTSLGSLVASLIYGVDDRVQHAAFMLGGADLAHLLWTSSRVVQEREALRRKGFTEDRLRRALEPVEPLRYLSLRQGGSSFVIGGKYDTVIPRQSTEELIHALHDPKVLWLETGHYGGIFVQQRLLKEVSRFFAARFAGQAFVPPLRLYAPTVRVAALANSASGLDLGVGIDFLRFTARGDDFGSVLITPRGPQVFLGHRISQGLSLGVAAGARRVGLGVLWSTVL